MEELIRKIQQGNEELMLELWNRLKGLVAWYAKRYFKKNANMETRGVEIDDLIQSGYIALVETVKAYNPEKGSFNALFPYFLKKQFREAIGIRSSKRNPLNDCVSLDIPAYSDDPEGPAWLDFVPDPHDRIAEVEEAVFIEELHTALEKALDAIPEKESVAIRSEYWEGRTLSEMAEKMGVSRQYIAQLRNNGLSHIRNSSAREKLEEFIDFETLFYKKVSVQQFTRTRTSAVEALVMFREGRRAMLGKSDCTAR